MPQYINKGYINVKMKMRRLPMTLTLTLIMILNNIQKILFIIVYQMLLTKNDFLLCGNLKPMWNSTITDLILDFKHRIGWDKLYMCRIFIFDIKFSYRKFI